MKTWEMFIVKPLGKPRAFSITKLIGMRSNSYRQRATASGYCQWLYWVLLTIRRFYAEGFRCREIPPQGRRCHAELKHWREEDLTGMFCFPFPRSFLTSSINCPPGPSSADWICTYLSIALEHGRVRHLPRRVNLKTCFGFSTVIKHIFKFDNITWKCLPLLYQPLL
jgi:hypothetical protein